MGGRAGRRARRAHLSCSQGGRGVAARGRSAGVPAGRRPHSPRPRLGRRRYWTLLDDPIEEWVPEAAPLPSDCRFREDLAMLEAGEIKYAQQGKEMLENMQVGGQAAALGGGRDKRSRVPGPCNAHACAAPPRPRIG